MNLSEKLIKFDVRPVPEHGDTFSIATFINLIKDGFFNDDDGYGRLLIDKENVIMDFTVYPSEIMQKYSRSFLNNFNGIIWFNK